MTRITTTLATLTAAVALATPAAAVAATDAPAKSRPSCTTVAAKVAEHRSLSGAQESAVLKACTTRNTKIDAARAEIKAARQASGTPKERHAAVRKARQKVHAARVEFRKAVKAIAKAKTA